MCFGFYSEIIKRGAFCKKDIIQWPSQHDFELNWNGFSWLLSTSIQREQQKGVNKGTAELWLPQNAKGFY
jgi:hypothetical protein